MAKVWPDIQEKSENLPFLFLANSSLIPIFYGAFDAQKDDDSASIASGKPGMRPESAHCLVLDLSTLGCGCFGHEKGVLGGRLVLLLDVVWPISPTGLILHCDWFRLSTLFKESIPFMRVFLSLALAWLAYLLTGGYWLLMQIGNGWLERPHQSEGV